MKGFGWDCNPRKLRDIWNGMIMQNLIDGLVIGARKCGTTWVYENFRLDADVTVSAKVKESGFFSDEHITESAKLRYLELIDRSDSENVKYVEVDTSVVYAPNFADNINLLASDAAVVLILRKPEDYLVSRIVHSIRKGEIKSGSLDSMMNDNSWLRDEIDYEGIISRFESIHTKYKLVIPFELLESNDTEFYSLIKSCLMKLETKKVFDPHIRNKVNVSRSSRLELLTIIITFGAKAFRGIGLHGVVNVLKRLGVHTLFELETTDSELRHLKAEAEQYILKNAASSTQIWKKIANEYL